MKAETSCRSVSFMNLLTPNRKQVCPSDNQGCADVIVTEPDTCNDRRTTNPEITALKPL